MNWQNFAPRAASLTSSIRKTVIRGGYGWSYDLGVFGSNFGHNVTQNPPVLSNQNLSIRRTASRDVFTLAQGPPALAPVTVELERHVPAAAGYQSEVPARHDHAAHRLPVQHRHPAPVDQQDRLHRPPM